MSHKGWNDPPKVSYDSFQQSTGKKSQLNKRPDYTIEQLKTQQASSPAASLTEPPKSDITIRPSIPNVTKEEQQVKDIDTLMESLNLTITKYEKHMQKRVLDDIRKRLDSFTTHWKDGKLTEPVKAAMTNLVDALATDDYTKADQIHVKLMVDYISEVSQWMIGIKKLIAIIRTSFNSS